MKEQPLKVEENPQPHVTPKYFGNEMMENNGTPPLAAAAATMNITQERILHLDPSLDMYGDPIPIVVNIRGQKHPHPLLGFILRTDPTTGRLYLETCVAKTVASKIPRWRSRIRFANLQTVDDNKIESEQHLSEYIAQALKKGVQSLRFVFRKLETRNAADEGVPQLHLDQLRLIHRLRVEMNVEAAQKRLNKTSLTPEQQDHRDQIGQKRYTRTQLKKRSNYNEWRAAEFAQHDKYRAQDMFGEPIPRPALATVLRWVWQRHWKEDATADEKGEFQRKC